MAPPAPWYKLYRGPLMPPPNVPADVDSLLTHINRVQNRFKFRDQGIDRHAVRSLKAFYYAAISFIDHQIGRITQALEQADLLDDTLIVFHSDHGELLGDYDSFGPRSFHDAASRVPLIVRYPSRFARGLRCERVASPRRHRPHVAGGCRDRGSFARRCRPGGSGRGTGTARRGSGGA